MSISARPCDVSGDPRRDRTEHLQHVLALTPLELLTRIRLARSVLTARFPETADRLVVERLLDGLPLAEVARMEAGR